MGEAIKLLSVEDILRASDIKEETVDVPEWGGSVRVRSFTKAQAQSIRERATLQRDTRDKKAGTLDINHMELLMFIEGVVEPKFSEGHLLTLKEKSAAAIERVNRAIARLSGMDAGAVQAAEARFQGEPGEAA